MTLHDVQQHAHLEELTQVVTIVDSVSQQELVMIGLHKWFDISYKSQNGVMFWRLTYVESTQNETFDPYPIENFGLL